MRDVIHNIVSWWHEIVIGVKPPKGFVASFVTLLFLLALGTLFYMTYEKWSLVDSLYFSVTTIATVGYGDLHPTTPISKVFTIFYIFFGVGIGIFIFSSLAKSYLDGRERRMRRLEELLKRSKDD
jgi:hypothetical protein